MKALKDLYSRVSGTGEAVLLIHGIMSDHESFTGIQKLLGKDFKVITYNRRGYGLASDSPYKEYSFDKQAEDAVSVLQRYTNGPVCMIGDSTGGAIAIRTALLYPEFVRGIFLVETVVACPGVDLSCLRVWQEGVRHIMESGDIYKMVPLFAKMTEAKPVARADKLKNIKKSFYNIRNFVYGEADTVMQHSFSYEDIRSIRCPVVMGISEEGKHLPFGTGAQKTADFFGWRTVYLPGHHNTVQEYPYEFFNRVKQFIATPE